MIGRLSGKIIIKEPPHLMIDINGVGYDVLAPMTTFYLLPSLGSNTVVHTHFAVSETSQQLYGFITEDDRKLFRLLIKVSGVGPKMALGIMSMEVNDFIRCIREENISAIVKIPGVGKKTAERLVIEMRDKLKDWNVSNGADETTPISVGGELGAVSHGRSFVGEAEAALVALGYKPTDAAKMIAKVNDPSLSTSEALIRRALKNVMPA